MSIYDLAPVAALLAGLHVLVEALISLLQPVWPSAAPTAAILLVTVAVRLALVPLAIRAARAERSGRAPSAALLPLLAQAPVLSLLYGVFGRTVIAGGPNLLLTQELLGMPFSGAILPGLLSGVLPWSAVLVSVGVLGIVALVAELTRRRAESARRAAGSAVAPPPAARALAATLPFVGVAVAAFVPFAAALYLATSAVWAALERAVVSRLVAR